MFILLFRIKQHYIKLKHTHTLLFLNLKQHLDGFLICNQNEDETGMKQDEDTRVSDGDNENGDVVKQVYRDKDMFNQSHVRLVIYLSLRFYIYLCYCLFLIEFKL